MRRREWALILTVIACLIYVQQTIVEVAFMYYVSQQVDDASTPKPYGPSISHCFHEGEERELWDCIRHVD